MSRHADNLGRAARMLKRMDDAGGPAELEGVSLKEIVADVLVAQNHAHMTEAMERVGLERPAPAPVPDNVVELELWSRKAGA